MGRPRIHAGTAAAANPQARLKKARQASLSWHLIRWHGPSVRSLRVGR
jgi:hypothetical protein